MKIGEQLRRKDVLVGEDAQSFEVLAMLQLASPVLKLLVRYEEFCKFASQDDADTVVVGQFAFVAHGEIGGGSRVGVVLDNRWIQVAISHGAVGAEGRSIFSPSKLRE